MSEYCKTHGVSYRPPFSCPWCLMDRSTDEIDRLKGEVVTVTKRSDWYKREYGKLLDEVKMLTAERGELIGHLYAMQEET